MKKEQEMTAKVEVTADELRALTYVLDCYRVRLSLSGGGRWGESDGRVVPGLLARLERIEREAFHAA